MVIVGAPHDVDPVAAQGAGGQGDGYWARAGGGGGGMKLKEPVILQVVTSTNKAKRVLLTLGSWQQ